MSNVKRDPKKLGMTLKGTTTIAIVCKDGIVLSTDTRATAGFFVAHKNAKKVFPLDDHLAMTIAGTVADAQNVVDILKANALLYKLDKNRPMPVNSMARLAANVLFGSRAYPLELQAIICGVDDTGAHIFALDPLGSVTEEKCFSSGSGSPVAFGVLDDGYKEGITTNDGIRLVIRAIDAAMKRDIGTGDSFDVAIVTKEGYRELSAEDKKKFFETRA